MEDKKQSKHQSGQQRQVLLLVWHKHIGPGVMQTSDVDVFSKTLQSVKGWKRDGEIFSDN